MRGRTILAVAALAAAITVSGTAPALAGNNKSGFRTTQPSMLDPGAMPGVAITPLMTVGDTLSSGYRFESIPDGISVRTRGKGTVDLFVNHETGKVPFPFVRANPNETNGENDFDNSQVSRLRLNQHSAGVLGGKFVIPSSFGYQRFCSNYLATAKEGFDREILFTNEESPDYVFRQENSWPPPFTDPPNPAEREAGLVVALDVKTGKHHPIQGMGRHNHENSVPVPGYGKPVVLSGDDTFTSGSLAAAGDEPEQPAQSQLYSYIAPNTKSLLADKGDMWAFVSDTEGVEDYYDVLPGSTTPVQGHFIKVPRNIATGLNPDGSELRSDDIPGFPEPPNNGSWQTDLRSIAPVGIDGPQWVLQHWSDKNDVFQFVRVEDVAYDKRPGMGNVVYIVDSGRGRTGIGPEGGQPFRSTNGRIWKMVLDPNDPKQVTSLTVFVEGDDNPVKTPTEIHQPDNLESTRNGLLVTEDPGSSQQYPAVPPPGPVDPDRTTARLMHASFANPALPTVVARVNQTADGGPTDVDGRPPGNWGAWESSGIVDASKAFGPDMYLIDIQAHTLWIERAPGEDNYAPIGPDFTYKREGGQLLLMRIPGA